MEKTEQPTAKKLREARARGEVPKSRELGAAAVLLAGWAALVATGGAILAAIVASWELALSAIGSGTSPAAVLGASTALGLQAIAPLLFVLLIVAALAGFVQVGPLFTLAPLAPRPERLDPTRGLRELFSQRRLVDLLRSSATLLVIAIVCFVTLQGSLRGVLGLVGRDAGDAIPGVGALVARLVLRVGLVLAAMAVLDVVYQRWRHRQDMKMTREELAREQRAAEGDPQTRHARSRAHRELVSRASIPERGSYGAAATYLPRGRGAPAEGGSGDPAYYEEADLVVVSPAEVAVALRHDPEGAGVPEVVAAARGEVAQRMLEAARTAAIFVVDDPPLARALAMLGVGARIPRALYEPVARHLIASRSDRR